jgi:hypothetical protein
MNYKVGSPVLLIRFPSKSRETEKNIQLHVFQEDHTVPRIKQLKTEQEISATTADRQCRFSLEM